MLTGFYLASFPTLRNNTKNIPFSPNLIGDNSQSCFVEWQSSSELMTEMSKVKKEKITGALALFTGPSLQVDPYSRAP